MNPVVCIVVGVVLLAVLAVLFSGKQSGINDGMGKYEENRSTRGNLGEAFTKRRR